MSETRDDRGSTRPAMTPAFRLPTLDAFEHRLSIVASDGHVLRVLESRQRSVTVGTAPTNALVVDDATVSRHHCSIHVEDGVVWLRDLDSLNGTRVDGVHVREARLTPGCLLELGDVRARYDCQVSRAPLYPSEEESFGELYGTAPAMRRLFGMLDRLRSTELTVLLLGETGTGKELAARALHARSDRAKRPFVTVDCGAISPELVDSQLFGHERGSFTGASRAHAGAFVAAEGGTVFLDEIGELPLHLQPRLLRALERREVVPLGSNQPVAFDVRVVAATHRDLRAAVAQGSFRADLYYRLAEVEVTMPSLGERREDVPELAQRLAPSGTRWTSDALAYLAARPWPGNVRELRNLVRRAAALADGAIDRGALEALENAPARLTRALVGEVSLPTHLELDLSAARQRWLAVLESRFLTELLEQAGFDLDLAARHAGIHRKSLQRLLREHGLDARGVPRGSASE